jgi:hypothetical protein
MSLDSLSQFWGPVHVGPKLRTVAPHPVELIKGLLSIQLKPLTRDVADPLLLFFSHPFHPPERATWRRRAFAARSHRLSCKGMFNSVIRPSLQAQRGQLQHTRMLPVAKRCSLQQPRANALIAQGLEALRPAPGFMAEEEGFHPTAIFVW